MSLIEFDAALKIEGVELSHNPNLPDVTFVWELGDYPAARAYVEANGMVEGLQGRHLKALASKLARELPYLPGTRQEAALRVLDAVQVELQRRPENCAECGEPQTPLSELCAFCGHTL